VAGPREIGKLVLKAAPALGHAEPCQAVAARRARVQEAEGNAGRPHIRWLQVAIGGESSDLLGDDIRVGHQESC
jgi:hypothetical protein